MTTNMFCFQCEQTAGGTGCTQAMGVCGKQAETARLQDNLISALMHMAKAAQTMQPTPESDLVMLEGLFTTVTNVSFDNKSIIALTNLAQDQAEKLNPYERSDYNAAQIWTDNEDVRSLKSLILFGLKGMAAYVYHAHILGYKDASINKFFYSTMAALTEPLSTEELLPLVIETGNVNLKCMELLDRANTETYGTPVPTTVSMTIEKGPFIVVTGHDLYDLHALLEATKDKGINIYTHGEMLPAHAYPKLKAYPHLKGNFGTAWQNQQKEFASIPGAVLFTTNCLMPVKDSYKDRVFTTRVVQYPEIVHVKCTDFSPVINKALELGGYPMNHIMTGINGGTQLTTGFGHGTVLSVADKVVDAVKSGAIKHFFLVGGCDGARPGRNYYTEFVKQTPADTVVLTLACGKYRFNDLDLGTIGGLPRIMDMGQCNDAYSAIKVAVALAEAFKCDVNALPLTLVLSWYEQKAVCILLTLLALGIKNIYIGPSLPAFVSPNVLKFLVDNYNITPISTPAEDLQKILGK